MKIVHDFFASHNEKLGMMLTHLYTDWNELRSFFIEPDGSDVQDSGGRSATATRSLQHTTKTTLSQVSCTSTAIDPVPTKSRYSSLTTLYPMCRMLDKDPNNRPSAVEILQVPFIQQRMEVCKG